MAYSFTDASGATREIRVTFRTIFNVADKTGFDLLNPGEEQNGVVLSEALLTKPSLVTRVVAALCFIEDEDAFYDAVDGKVYAELEVAFWNAYSDFFIQCGRDWLAVAIKKSLEGREARFETTKRALLDLQTNTYSDSSPRQESKTGSTEHFGKSPDSRTQISGRNRATALKSSAESTTPTQKDEKTLETQKTSTSTRGRKVSPKRESS